MSTHRPNAAIVVHPEEQQQNQRFGYNDLDMRALQSIILVILSVGCVEPYMPPLNEDTSKFLVVDGYVSSDGSAVVHLGRSVPLTHADNFPPESKAVVTIRSSSGKT